MEDKTDAQLDAAAGLLRCRRQLPEDETFLWEVYASTRQEELDRTGWSPAQRKIFLDSQFKAMRHGYASQFPHGEFSVIMLGEKQVGLMVVDRAENELRLVDIALLPEYRGRGIGSFYLKKLAAEAALAQKPLRLHVFKASRPWRLYERLGFVKIEEDGPYDHLEWRPQAAGPNAPSGPARPGG
jgi:ribosomal protein S18 acetylase RimI-like enzyme